MSVATLWRTPSAPRRVDAPALARPARIREWLSAMTTEQRRGLNGRADTQVLYGDRVVVLRLRKAWARVAVPDQPAPGRQRGYLGWVPRRQLTGTAPMPTAERATVTTALAWLRSDDGAWIVRDGAAAPLVRVESLPGDALVAATVAGGALLTTTALSASELAELMAQGARPGDIVRVVAGEAVIDRVTAADAEDLAAWIDVGAVDVVAVTSLGEPPVAVVVVEDGPSTARGVLKGVTAASGAAFAKALASARDTLVRGGGEAAAPLSAGVAKVVGALATAVAWMQQKLRPSEDQLPPRTDTALPPRALPAASRPTHAASGIAAPLRARSVQRGSS